MSPANPDSRPAPEIPPPDKGWNSRGDLPHYDSSGVIQSVTFRLGDSLPKETLLGLRERHPDDGEYRKALEAYADAGYGVCLLRRPEFARIVRDRLLHDHGKRYVLHAWCISPTMCTSCCKRRASRSATSSTRGNPFPRD